MIENLHDYAAWRLLRRGGLFQKTWRYVPMLAAFRNHGHGPLIVFGDRSGQFRMAVGMEPYLFTYPKIEHRRV